MRNARLLASQVRYEQKAFWRNPAAGIFTVGFPIMFLLIFGSTNHSTHVTGNPGVSYDQYLVPAMLAYGLMNSCFTALAIAMTIRRESGILKRIKGTPLPPYIFLGGVIGNSVLISILTTVIVVTIGIAEFGISMPTHPAVFVVVILIGVVAFCTMGLAVTIFVPNADSAPAIVNGIYLPIIFISGVFFPISNTSILHKIGNVFPVNHFAQSLLATFAGYGPGFGITFREFSVVIIWSIVSLWIAIRRFRWEPRK